MSMKRSTLLTIIAICLLAIYFMVDVGYVVIFVPLVYGLWLLKEKLKGKAVEDVSAPTYDSIEDVTTTLGEPDAVIIIDATRGNEIKGVILAYQVRRLLIVVGEEVQMDDIMDVNISNSATPYTIGEYQVVLTTRQRERQYIRVNVGYDAEFAAHVGAEVMAAIALSRAGA